MTSASAEHTVPWCCPLCGDPLSQRDRALSCPSRHSFDIAREGYVNLLPANRKRSRDPGDNREMIEARRRVHAADVYRPLAERLASLVSETAGGDARVLDLGCGEGYYAAVLLQHCPDSTVVLSGARHVFGWFKPPKPQKSLIFGNGDDAYLRKLQEWRGQAVFESHPASQYYELLCTSQGFAGLFVERTQ